MATRRMQFRAIEDLEAQIENGLLRIENAVSALGAGCQAGELGASGNVQLEMILSAPRSDRKSPKSIR